MKNGRFECFMKNYAVLLKYKLSTTEKLQTEYQSMQYFHGFWKILHIFLSNAKLLLFV